MDHFIIDSIIKKKIITGLISTEGLTENKFLATKKCICISIMMQDYLSYPWS